MEKTPTETHKLKENPSPTKKYQFFINDNELNSKNYKHKNNKITTTKYNIFTFLPKSLLFQFFRLANVYFLFIAIIQTIPQISPLSSSTAWGPLAFVLCVSMIREAIEDYARYKYDKEQNNEKATVYRDGQWKEVKSMDLRIGELVLVHEDDRFPADLILIDSNNKDGLAYIETGTLDGEKTPKLKLAQKISAGFLKDENGHYRKTFSINGHIVCDSPNTELYQLDGAMEISLTHTNSENQSAKVPLVPKQLLLKGALLRNTQWIVGTIVYTGHNTKLLKNSKNPEMKYSRIEKFMSKLLIVIFLLQVCFCIIAAVLFGIYYRANVENNNFLPRLMYSFVVDSVINYFTYTLLLNTMIPISLIISLEVVKVWQGYFISVDVEGYSHVRNEFMKAGSVSLNEELGQVNFVFSDKTGTLTCNKMEYKFGVIGDVCYEYLRGKDDDLNAGLRKEKDIIAFKSGSFANKLPPLTGPSKYPNCFVYSENGGEKLLSLEQESDIVSEYWKALAICHQCEVVERESGEREYSSLSPDDIELVKTARAQGYEVVKSPSSTVRRVNIKGEVKDFEILNVIEFDSDRKRMSVIVRDGNIIKLYIKGADSVIEWWKKNEKEQISRISNNSKKEFLQQAKSYIDYFSNQGYRTLLVGMKVITQKEYDDWAQKLNEANLNETDKKAKVNEVVAQMEKNIYILGATIVEDKLQDMVPETIRDLRLAGIKVWMLTGDKVDTAYNIGLSCNLISTEMEIFKIQGEKGDKLSKLQEEFKKFLNKNSYSNPTSIAYSILIDHITLTSVLESKEQTTMFLDIAYGASSVLCCRVSPKQKSQVVKMVKHYDAQAVTLAIGDGGNDVPMITEAHIGIGLCGEEGKQAVNSGDYALGEFKVLRRLLMFHGRSNNIRVSKMILYFFYKNFVFTIVHFYFAFYNNFSGQTIIDDWFITFYNMIFTAFPLCCLSIIDFDLRPDDGKVIDSLLPFLYKENRDKPIFNILSFSLSLFRGIIHGLINFFFIVYTLGVDNTDDRGNYADLWFISVALFTNIIFIVSMRIIIITRFHTYINWLVIGILSWILYIIFVIVVNSGSAYNSFATMAVAFGGGKFYFDFVLIVGTCAMIDLFTESLGIIFNTSLSGTLMVLVKERTTVNNRRDLPEYIMTMLSLSDASPKIQNNKLPQVESKENNVLRIDKRKANEVDLERVDGVKINTEREPISIN